MLKTNYKINAIYVQCLHDVYFCIIIIELFISDEIYWTMRYFNCTE